jgi:hypothetical protein
MALIGHSHVAATAFRGIFEKALRVIVLFVVNFEPPEPAVRKTGIFLRVPVCRYTGSGFRRRTRQLPMDRPLRKATRLWVRQFPRRE